MKLWHIRNFLPLALSSLFMFIFRTLKLAAVLTVTYNWFTRAVKVIVVLTRVAKINPNKQAGLLSLSFHMCYCNETL